MTVLDMAEINKLSVEKALEKIRGLRCAKIEEGALRREN
jgi:hypothetical protein